MTGTDPVRQKKEQKKLSGCWENLRVKKDRERASKGEKRRRKGRKNGKYAWVQPLETKKPARQDQIYKQYITHSESVLKY